MFIMKLIKIGGSMLFFGEYALNFIVQCKFYKLTILGIDGIILTKFTSKDFLRVFDGYIRLNLGNCTKYEF